jgi:Mn2+/Fe2+ NRAMP family transporter
VPLVWLTAQKSVMGRQVNTRLTTALASLAAVVVISLNVALLARLAA